jgi:multicomponent Na+:H+ antiporter subunit C
MLEESVLMVGFLVGCAVYLILQSSFVRILLGFAMLSNAVNILVLLMSGAPDGKSAPVVNSEGPFVDPLPQALVLTAIVIGFGVLGYMVMLFYRLFKASGTTNADVLFAGGVSEVGGKKGEGK